MTVDFAKEYLLDDCADCPENENGECMTESHCFEVKRMAIQALEQTRWIPVSERLPEIGQTVLISVKKYNYRKQNSKHHRKCDRFVYNVHIEKFTDLGCFQRYPLQVITAWMPLPQPYKGESEV